MLNIKLEIGNWKLEIPAKQGGQALVELLVTLAIASVLMPGLITGLFASREGKAQTTQRLDATALLREADEALRVVRESGWMGVSTSGTYYPQASGSSWVLTAGSQTLNGYTRQIVISDAYRDPNGSLAASGTPDPSTKKAVITVSWNTPYSSSVTSTIYLTRYLNNAMFTQTSVADFAAGTLSGTVVTNTNGGEVTLGAGGGGDWCSPNQSIVAQLDLPKSSAARAITAVEGEAFVGTGQDSSGESLVDISISNTNPPVPTIIETFDGYKTNDVFGEPNYAYIATDTNAREVIIIDISSIPFTEVGYFNAGGSEDGESIFVLGTVGYLIQDDKLWTFDLTSKSGSRLALDPDGFSLRGDGSSVYVVGNYAYVALEGSSKELQIVDVSNPSNMSNVGQFDVDPLRLNSGDVARDVFVNQTGTRAYLVISATSALKELFIVDVTNKSSPTLVGSYEANGMSPRGVTVVPGNIAIIVGSGAEEYQVIDIGTESNPTRCGGFEVNTSVFDVESILESDGDAFSYITTGDSNAELKIIEGGPGGQFATSGTFTSSPFDAGSAVAYNRLIPNFTEPPNTNLEFQVAGATAVSGSCTNASYYFIGPDGTSNTYFATASQVPFINNGQGYVYPAQCFKYKGFFSTSDPAASPILNDASVNYSP